MTTPVQTALDTDVCVEDLARENQRLRAWNDALVTALTPSDSTKVAYMHEFSIRVPEIDEAGNGYMRQINVPWITIKEVMAVIRGYASGIHSRKETSCAEISNSYQASAGTGAGRKRNIAPQSRL